MTEHTPGPWEYHDNEGLLKPLIASGDIVIAFPYDDDIPTEEYWANVYLMEAAPRLLAASKAWIAYLDGQEYEAEWEDFYTAEEDSLRLDMKDAIEQAVNGR